MKGLIVFLMMGLAVAGCHAQKEHVFARLGNNNSLLWEISGNGLKHPSFLFGTFHLLCKEDIKFSDPLKEAVKESNEIYMELDMDDPSTLLGGMLYMNMKGGKKLSELYSPADYKRLQAYFNDSLQMPLLLLQSAKPYFLVALLYPRMMNCSSPSGVEEELVKMAKDDKMEIQGLETVQFQASVFDSIPYEWQAKELLKNIDSFPTYKAEFTQMVQLYKKQQLDSMQTMVGASEFGDDKYDDLLVNDRNKKWVAKLDSIMKNESVFVAVGAGHLGGNEGLISLLKKQGYQVVALLNQ